MAATPPRQRKLEDLSARLTMAAALNDSRGDPDSFTRLPLALARAGGHDVFELAQLLRAGGVEGPDVSCEAPR